MQRKYSILAAIILMFTCIIGCGGGTGSTSTGSGSPPPTPPPPSALADFSVTASPQQLMLLPGSSGILNISVTGTNGFSGQVNINLAGLSSGVTAAPTSSVLAAGNGVQITLSAAANLTYSTGTLTINATSGSLSHSAQALLTVTQITPTALYAPIRARYIRTDSFYDPNSLEFAPPHFTVYSPQQKRFFVSNPYRNRIDVFDAALEIEIGQIIVPGAWGIDISPDGKTLYAGTYIGDVYVIDPAAMQVIRRVVASTIGPSGFSATEAFVLADGRLALLGAVGGLSVDGSTAFAIWNPTDNSFVKPASFCVQNIGPFALSGDRTRVLISTIDEGGGGETVCSYDPVAGVFTTGVFPPATFVRQIIPTPDGKRFFLTSNLNGVAVFDAHTVQLLGQITGPTFAQIPNAASGAVISLDGKTLYLVDQTTGAVGAFDTTSFVQKSKIPSFRVNDAQSGAVIAAIDETGLIVGPTGHGVDFLDASQAMSVQPTILNLGDVTPTAGPTTGGTALNILVELSISGPPPPVSQIFVGNTAGTAASLNGPSAQISTPPSSRGGAADVAIVLSDRGLGIIPEGFSYGPTIIEVTPDSSVLQGGTTGVILGYGFGTSLSGVQVTIGGSEAQVTALKANPSPITPYLFPLDSLNFTIPAGTTPGPVEVTVTTPTGTAAAPAAFHYTKPLVSYPLAASLQEGIYDHNRGVLYFTDRAQVQRFSPSSGQWLTSISMPNTDANTSLLALALSPDGSKLVVSDAGNANIFLLNPDSPASVQNFHVQNSPFDISAGIEPCGVAVTNSGVVYFASFETGGTGAQAFHKIDTSGKITNLGNIFDVGNVFVSPDKFIRVRMTPDSSRVYLNESDDTYVLNTADDTILFGPGVSFGQGPNELELSGDGTRLVTGFYLADANLNPISAVSYADRDTWFVFAVYGQKMNANGSLMFQPLTNGIDILDGETGLLLNRIVLPITLANVYDSLVIDEKDGFLFAITPSGIAQIDLGSLPISHSASRSTVQPDSPLGQTALIPLSTPLAARATHMGDGHLQRNPAWLTRSNGAQSH